jgi:DNA primase catalytic core, N-terminal domain
MERIALSVSEEIVRKSAEFFEEQLWDSDSGARVRGRLIGAGLEEATMREFGVGYAPGDVRKLLELLAELGYSDEELVAAGVATASERGYAHPLFHARVMFPIRAESGIPLGFAGLATHLGPSWALWVRSPRCELFRPDQAIFGLDRARHAIAGAQHALVKRECVEVMRLHQDGREDAVGVVQNPITGRHLAALAAALGVPARDLRVLRNRRLDAVLVQSHGMATEADAFGPGDRPYRPAIAPATTGSDWTRTRAGPESIAPADEPPQGARGIVYVGGILIGSGIPLGTLLVLSPDTGEQSSATPALNIVIVTVAAAYVILAVAVSIVSARRRVRSGPRRMRLPWARGSGEVQPRGWTYNSFEDLLAGAALVSALICLILWMTLGGFLG